MTPVVVPLAKTLALRIGLTAAVLTPLYHAPAVRRLCRAARFALLGPLAAAIAAPAGEPRRPRPVRVRQVDPDAWSGPRVVTVVRTGAVERSGPLAVDPPGSARSGRRASLPKRVDSYA